jgi:hypothetical protein
MLVCWILLFAYRELTRGITLDYINYVLPPVDDIPPGMHDGVGENALVLFMGWLPAFFTLSVLFVLRRAWRWLRPKSRDPVIS